MEPIKLLQEHCKFNNEKEVYVLFGIARKKDNKDLTNGTEIVFREVIKKEKDIELKYNKIKYTCESNKDYNFYIYVSVNPRDSIKSLFHFRNIMDIHLLQALNGSDESNYFKRIDKQWYSSLMTPANRSSKGKWLVDFDKGDIDEFLMKTYAFSTVSVKQKTKNGYHLVIQPFNIKESALYNNPKDFPEFEFEIKRDALLFVEYINKQ